MDMGEVRGYITVLTMIAFLGIFWWAYRSGNRERFEDDAMIPFREAEGAKGVAGAVTDRSGESERKESKNDE